MRGQTETYMKGVDEGTTINHEILQLSEPVSWFNHREAIALVAKVEEIKDGVRNMYAGREYMSPACPQRGVLMYLAYAKLCEET
jgi:hypothetical protein